MDSPLSNDYTNTKEASNFYPVGTTTVTWTIFDQAGNFTDCEIDVVVIEGQDPDIRLSSQAEVDDFVANYGNLRPILGNLTISGADITDLSGLASFSSIGGDLWIESNPALTNIDALQNLQKNTGLYFEIIFNDALTEFCGLFALATAEPDTFTFSEIRGNAENPSLEDIIGSEACSRILALAVLPQPAEDLPVLPLPYLVLLGLILLGVASRRMWFNTGFD